MTRLTAQIQSHQHSLRRLTNGCIILLAAIQETVTDDPYGSLASLMNLLCESHPRQLTSELTFGTR